jgi:hypothetical protein
VITNRQFIFFYLPLPIDSILCWWLRKTDKLFWIFCDDLAFEGSLETVEKYDRFFDHLLPIDSFVSLSRNIDLVLRIIVLDLVITFFCSKAARSHYRWFVYISKNYIRWFVWDYIFMQRLRIQTDKNIFCKIAKWKTSFYWRYFF